MPEQTLFQVSERFAVGMVVFVPDVQARPTNVRLDLY